MEYKQRKLLPAGIDDCCVHFLCGYCASHQELREAIMRGLDGPGRVSEFWQHFAMSFAFPFTNLHKWRMRSKGSNFINIHRPNWAQSCLSGRRGVSLFWLPPTRNLTLPSTAGISPLDVWPASWKHVEGFEQEMEHRKAKLEILREAGQLFLPFEQRIDVRLGL